MKLVWTLIMLLGWVCQGISASQPLQLSSREDYQPRNFHLDDAAWRWLGEKRMINVAVWKPSIPPLEMFSDEGVYEGISADYIKLISQYLGLRVVTHEYSGRDEAITALIN
ncbi:hypothetical protein, partial [Klebsiella pneumoniae]|uniref:hypothetical protein n=1 Tax=Klebsiella pneumoniae TaxID=573 RepID=UPI002DBC976C